MPRNNPRIEMPESEENEFASLSLFSPSRAPLNLIPDPSQVQKTTPLSDFDLAQKLEVTRTQGPEKRVEGRGGNALDSNPRIVTRNVRSRSEPNSAQSTPTRNGVRVSLGGGCVTGARVSQSFAGRGTNSRIPRGIYTADSVETTPHFELNEDHSFWKEHNVQVLIRLRPLSTMERATQGHGRCLKQESPQTLLWLGHPETRFTFDHVASETISQEKLFRVAGLPLVENCLSGYNSCVFAYGQTGSGKTYTMMGEISEAEGSLGEDCGVTARIFEYLFSRIKLEEEGRRDEKLRFSCKCSFLEIYNEQITDLLEPSSTNLQLREDLGKGVYVENLVEHNVRTVNDVLKLLLQGAANRKIAATHMNSESSRSHSVFTCTIESIWERDSLTHSRFARLNLVDLAGSERQKSSGAEGDRLKEAANINKSLSTLGLVIMSLVDLAQGKHRHVPYRDSRLTFLLQDSLGGNSKTMIIANVSPSLCSTNETLSTLKFAQRAKLIQNNAKVNEDASGDVTALQQEIRKLKLEKRRKQETKKMATRLPFFFLFHFLYTVTTLTPSASGATSCRTSCGSIPINYPFGIDQGCGSPQFKGMLNCSSTDLYFVTPSGGYKVRSIDYDGNTMVVFDPAMSTCSILQPHHDFKLSDIQNVVIRPSYDTVFALFNCSNDSPVHNRYRSLCFNAAGHSCDELYSSCTSFRIFNTTSPYGGNSTVHTTPYCCFTSYDTVRVMSMNILDCSHYTTVIDGGKMRGVAPTDWSYGIELSYSVPEIGCGRCRKSGGTCGFDDETEIFLCQCPNSNNISTRDCGGGASDQGGCNSTNTNYATMFLAMLLSFIWATL